MILPCSLLVLAAVFPQGTLGAYYGVKIGPIDTKEHDFKGMVYVASEKQLFIVNMTYDGQGPAAQFWAGSGQYPQKTGGEKIKDEDGSEDVLQKYEPSDVLLTLPKNVKDYEYFGILCTEANANFGHVEIPQSNFEFPAEQRMTKLTNTGDMTLKDSATIEIKSFTYTAGAGDLFFAAGKKRNAAKDTLMKLKDESGKDAKVGSYNQKDIKLNLPDGHHWNEFEWFVLYNFSGFGGSVAEVDIPLPTAEKLPVHNPKSNVKKPNSKNEGPHGVAPSWLVLLAAIACLAASTFVWRRSGVRQHSKEC